MYHCVPHHNLLQLVCLTPILLAPQLLFLSLCRKILQTAQAWWGSVCSMLSMVARGTWKLATPVCFYGFTGYSRWKEIRRVYFVTGNLPDTSKCVHLAPISSNYFRILFWKITFVTRLRSILHSFHVRKNACIGIGQPNLKWVWLETKQFVKFSVKRHGNIYGCLEAFETSHRLLWSLKSGRKTHTHTHTHTLTKTRVQLNGKAVECWFFFIFIPHCSTAEVIVHVPA